MTLEQATAEGKEIQAKARERYEDRYATGCGYLYTRAEEDRLAELADIIRDEEAKGGAA